MAREFAVTLYLGFFSILFKLFSLLPINRKVTFVVSFSENNISIYEEFRRQEASCRTIFLSTKKQHALLKQYERDDCTILLFEPSSSLEFIKGIYHIATSKVILVDNYYGFLSTVNFRKGVKCLQIWHANGAIKRFGLKDPAIESRSLKAKKRFKEVYKKFDHVIVGSDEMASIFSHAFETPEENFLKTGIPRTDLFFDQQKAEHIKETLYKRYPASRTKKTILYAPTFRDEDLESYEIRINFDLMKAKLGPEYLLLLKLHPAIKNRVEISEELSDFVIDVSGYSKTNDLLFITDILITDYSSIPFEFSLLEKPMVFFPYDLSHYQKTRGMWEDYEELVPGPVVFSTQDIIHAILNSESYVEEVKHFNTKWNQYTDGNASERMVKFILENCK
ncbi:CDP-glycerol glycerophosphotransferase family protein [Cytobacillus firmus]|uniref:CDP-glycerol glycerophosphotransferase family protein n=1 Tax=Cytobacillus TaxID=2675230 RepID=UPI001D15B767|nr:MULTISPECIES: CDP-glycerol glycerophosphotransferase family protein [Cytobacillus]MCC3648538.1 CDP-glycerol glycerophosphotransferase family protein [Cytobacillus oceanisediminis]USK38640.1 CDP-glycerol glycerophosphotransferase family protein [Cytobacillus firmus]